MDDLNPRLRAVCDLNMAEMREYSGRHEYDGQAAGPVPGGGARWPGPARRGGRGRAADWRPARRGAAGGLRGARRLSLGELAAAPPQPGLCTWPRWTWLATSGNTVRPPDRERARLAHLAAWPTGGRGGHLCARPGQRAGGGRAGQRVRGLVAGIPGTAAPPGAGGRGAPRMARLVGHVDDAAAHGAPDAALGGPALAALMSSAEGVQVDLGELGERADAERDRLSGLLAESCARVDPGRPPLAVARELVRDHPDAEGVHGRGPVLDGAGHRVHQGPGLWCPTRMGSAWSGWRPRRAGGPWR